MGEALERLVCDEIDGLLGQNAAILGLDVAYLSRDLPEDSGIESRLHLTEDRLPTITASAKSQDAVN
jgi:hypothetical protein